ncbi:MAG: DUF835 domain-containing protein [Spirochaetales bacterium]|nr:DUF835 domain-containing protein [Spirochaetales bacterium]
MNEWFFFPWSIQYLAGAVLALVITVPLFLSNSRIWVNRSFLGFGLCIFFYCMSAFFHRNAPTEELSKFFFRIDLFFASIINIIIFLMILFLWKEKFIFIAHLLPGLAVGFYGLIVAPFTITWSPFGWSYISFFPFNIMIISIALGYTLLSLVSLLYLMKKVPLKILQRKYKIIIAGMIICTPGSLITTMILQAFPDFPPFAGIWVILQFLFISIAISLKENKIEISLEDVFDSFLSKLFSLIPGREFGHNFIEFTKYIEFTQLNRVVTISGDLYVFNKAYFSKIDLIEVLIRNIEYLEKREYRKQISLEFMALFSYVYKLFYSETNQEISILFDNIIRKHGDYLLESNALYNIGNSRYLKMFMEDNSLAGLDEKDKLLNFFKKLRLALNAYTKSVLGELCGVIPDIILYKNPDFNSIYMAYNKAFYKHFNSEHEKNDQLKEGLLPLAAQVIRIHNNITIGIPIIPVFFYENLFNDLYRTFSEVPGEDKIRQLKHKESFFKYLEIAEGRIYFSMFDTYYLRNQLIVMCKTFVKCFVNEFTEKSLKQFLFIMSKYSFPEAEIIIDDAKVCIIKGNNNLGYLLLNRFTKLRYPTLYIGKKVEDLSLFYKSAIIIEKKTLIDEMTYENQVSFNNLNKLLNTIMRFIKDNENPVIMLNGIDEMLYINSFEKVLAFLKEIRSIMEDKKARLILLGNLLTLNEFEEQIIEQCFTLLKKNNFYYRAM